MGFWLFELAMDLLIPAVLIVFGRRFLRHPPKEINAAYGYRTTMSMKNADTWRFAHEYCGRLWLRLGIALAPLSAAPLLFVLGRDKNTIGITCVAVCVVQIVLVLLTIVPTERALRKNFDRFGRRK